MAREVSNIAPWAEIVPGAPYPMSIDEFERWPEEPGWRYELVRGRLVRMPWPGGQHGIIAHRVSRALDAFVSPRGLGDVFDGSGFRLPQPGNAQPMEFAPDVAFVAAGRGPQPGTPDYEDAWNLAPDLVAEVASRKSNQYRPEMTAKAHEYLQAGVRLVWIVYPQWNEIDVWWPEDQGPESQTLTAAHSIDGRDVLPGFTHPIARFFPMLDKQ